MMAICENCRAAYSVKHTRGVRLKDRACPVCGSTLHYATLVGFNDAKHALYQARSKPELKFPAIWNLLRSQAGQEARAV